MFLSPFVVSINFIGSICSILLFLVLSLCVGVALKREYNKMHDKK